MWGRLAVWTANFALNRAKLTVEDRNSLVIHILERLHALPLSDTIYQDNNGNIIVNGRSLELEDVRALHSHATNALENKALTLIRQQVMYQATTIGLMSKAHSDLDLLFSRAAIWWGQQEQEKLLLLARRIPEPDGNQD